MAMPSWRESVAATAIAIPALKLQLELSFRQRSKNSVDKITSAVNGTSVMLDAAVRSSGLAGTFRHVLSVDGVRAYKPSPTVYELGPRAFGVPAGDIVFVSSNAWDVAGAKAFGYRTCWCNRLAAPMDRLGVSADFEVRTLDEIPGKLG